MKILLALFFALNISVVHAKENIFFKKIPPYITTSDAIIAVSKAAISRKWTVYEFENKRLRIELNHRGYKAKLEFFFSDNEIYYSDLTTYYSYNDDEDEFLDSFAEDTWIAEPAPENWIRNLQNDTGTYFLYRKTNTESKEKLTYENIALKLKGLKSLYNDKLITESEYKLKKKELMSRY